ncbi:MAG: hypothetical protein KDC75_25410 [Phaeodactylibacter sp.]|nr:hypothetical protein [Phaeodactylibacter sp.]
METLERRPGEPEKGKLQANRPSIQRFLSGANTAYSKIYGVSEATASRYRMAAHNAGFLEVREQLRPTGLTDNNRLVVKFWKEEYGKQLVYKKGQYYEQDTSVVQSNLIRKRISALRWKKMNA